MDDMRKLFDEADADGNGFLDHDEVSLRPPNAVPRLGGQSQRLVIVFPNLILYTLSSYDLTKVRENGPSKPAAPTTSGPWDAGLLT